MSGLGFRKIHIKFMKKKVYIIQPRHLGDIIFVMAIAQKYKNSGFTVFFPVDDVYLGKASIQKSFPGIKFVPMSGFKLLTDYGDCCIHEDEHKIVINLLNTSKYKKHMEKKYLRLYLPVDFWRNVRIERDTNAENALLKILKISEGEKFNLINEYYSNKKSISMEVKIDNNYRNVYLKNIEGYSLFDWIGVIERAESIHSVHTSIQYIIDILENTTKELHIYPRSELYEPHSFYDYLFFKKYQYHPHPKNLFYQVNFNFRKLKRSIFRFFKY
jgi:hypothetical protein